MPDPLNWDLANSEFKLAVDGSSMVYIRWGTFPGSDGTIKTAAFMVDGIDASVAANSGTDFMAASNVIAESEAARGGEQKQAYEWHADRFEKVDINEQNWFKF